MKKRTSLATKFTITLLIILLIGQGIAGVLFIMPIRQTLVDSLNKKMQMTGGMLARISARPILDNNGDQLNSFLEAAFSDEDFISISVFNKDRDLMGEKRRFTERSSKINPFSVAPFFETTVPVFLEHDKVGSIVITSSTNRINNEILKRMVFVIILQGILFVLIVILVTGFFSRGISKPISGFSTAVNKARSGDLTVEMEPSNDLEMMILTEGFNSLIARLRNTIGNLHSTTSDVTMAIKQINMVIDKVTGGTNNQMKATEDVISALRDADRAQREILDNTQNLAEFSEENLSSLIQIKSTGEEIAQSAEQLFHSSSDTYSTIAQMSAAAKAIAKSTEELSTSTEETSASVEQMGSNLQEIEISTRESARHATEVREAAAGTGMMSLTAAMDGMEDIEQAVNKSLELVKNLGTKSKDIEKILSVITDVTKQTNLLSVNAAVLASQAGEYGKGFAVVADEIKTLSDRMASYAKGIANIIKSIQRGIAETAHVTGHSKLIVENGKDLVIKIGSAFGSVLEGTQKSSEMTGTIQRATGEQVRGVEQIKEAMEMIRLTVEHVSTTTHEQEKGSESLVAVAEKIKEISESIKRSMQEQNSGIRLISKNVELTNERIKSIIDATSGHGKTNEGILHAADKIRAICNDTLLIAQEMTASFGTLYNEAEALKRDMEGFRLE